jgi:hypothetical protein
MAGNGNGTRRAVARSAPGAKTTNVIVPPSAIVILDLPAATEDAFTLTSSKGKEETKKTSDSKPLDETHNKITFAVKESSKSTQTYTLVQKRGKKARHMIFTKIPSSHLSMDNEKPPQIRLKQYYTLILDLPDPHDPDLEADPVNYAAIAVKEPKTL